MAGREIKPRKGCFFSIIWEIKGIKVLKWDIKGKYLTNTFCVLKTISLVWHGRTIRKAVTITSLAGLPVCKNNIDATLTMRILMKALIFRKEKGCI